MDEDEAERRRRMYREDFSWAEKNRDKISWVQEAGREMETIKVGMTRHDLEMVFRPDGGISGPTNGVYVYRHCPYFKIYVTFRMFNDERGKGGHLMHTFHPEDVIIEKKGPYVVPWQGGG